MATNIAYTTNGIPYGAAPPAPSYEYNYRYAQPRYYTVAAPAAPAPTIVREVATAPVVATYRAPQIVVQAARPAVQTITVASPIAAAPVAYTQPAPLTYTYSSYAPYYGSYILKK